MSFKIGDLVTRNSHNNDTIFVITDIKDEICYLKGVNVRLIADSNIDDLQAYDKEKDIEEEQSFIGRLKEDPPIERGDYFYVPGRVLHIDADNDYLNRCLAYYEQNNIQAVGVNVKESDLPFRIRDLLEEYNPDIVVITGHDAYYKRKGSLEDVNAYKNSLNFIKAIKEARKYEKSHEKLIIIAGACQSNYEQLIKSGANFASSPKRINIHALDPAIIATKISLLDVAEDINVKELLDKTKYGHRGMGGIKTKGTMHVGYPR